MSIEGGNSGSESMQLLQLLANPVEFQKRVSEFDAAKRAAEDKIALLGAANEIHTLRSEAKKNAEASVAMIEEAQTKADRIIKDAEEAASDTKTKANSYAASAIANAEAEAQKNADYASRVLADAQAKASLVNDAIAKAESREREATGAIAMASAATKAAEHARKEAEKAQKDAQAIKSAMSQAAKDIASALTAATQ